MQAIRIEATIEQDGALTLDNLPLQAGERVEVIILVQSVTSSALTAHPLRGTLVGYSNPTGPVADGDWEAGR